MHTYLLGGQIIFENVVIVSLSTAATAAVESVFGGFSFFDVGVGAGTGAAVAQETTSNGPATTRLFFFIGWNGFDNGLNA